MNEQNQPLRLLSFFAACAAVILMFSFTIGDDSEAIFASDKTISAMSYNIRFDNPEDKSYNWEDRKMMISQTISSTIPDVIGVQEAYYNQIKWLDNELELYDWYAVGSDDGQFRGEHCAIFFNKEKYEKLDSGTYWLSNELDKPGSIAWDADEPAVLTWVKLKVQLTGESLYVFNTRLAEEETARIEGGKLIHEKIESLAQNNSFILTGDFNAEPDDETVKLLTDKYNEAKDHSFIKSSTLDYTFVGSEEQDNKRKLQDYVFFSKDFPVNSYEVINTKYNQKYPSDHLPVLCKLRLP